MTKTSNRYRFLCFCLSLFWILTSAVLPLHAADSEKTVLHLSTAEEFLTFAEHCRLDRYSQKLSVLLDRDLDFSGIDFAPIPIFEGTFDGCGHSIRGLSITGDGSYAGLFRRLTESAAVKNLTVEGSILPGGTQNRVGGIAGCNEGHIVSCTFRGETAGGDSVGGIAGINTVSGIIDRCTVEGSIHGSHFVGGIAGENTGLIRSCKNEADINTTAGENSVRLSEITPKTIAGTESANTVTDIGGIAGTSGGVIRSCENNGPVGYQHMGYNIGGIAGSQMGYIAGCQNHAPIHGRKEVGGIAGQMEPATEIIYEDDTLQILRDQLKTTSSLVDQASSHIKSHSETHRQQIDSLQYQLNLAENAVRLLLPKKEAPFLPDLDTIIAAKNTISSSLSSVRYLLNAMAVSSKENSSVLSDDIRAITQQLDLMSETLGSASDTLGGSVRDVSDRDTAENTAGKVENCINDGPVSGDYNTGGITGAVAWENDLDPEEDVEFVGSLSLNFQQEYRAVVKNCHNSAEITVKKRNIGGIAGKMALGLIKDCTNTGDIAAESAEYAGGIAGKSAGIIRNSYAKNKVNGRIYVGGIAGDAAAVTNCISIVSIEGAAEKSGAIAGAAEQKSTFERPFTGNRYFPVSKDPGGIDGVSYAGLAEPALLDRLLALKQFPERFRNVTIVFRFPDASEEELTLALGEVLTAEDIPEVRSQDGRIGVWDQIDALYDQTIYFDAVLETLYSSCCTVIESIDTRESGIPILLAEGQFYQTSSVDLTPAEHHPHLSPEEHLLEAWQIPEFGEDLPEKLHMALPEQEEDGHFRILVQGKDGIWKDTDCKKDGRYLIFSLTPGDQAFSLISVSYAIPSAVYFIGGIAAAVLIHLLAVYFRRKKQSPRNPPPQTPQAADCQNADINSSSETT